MVLHGVLTTFIILFGGYVAFFQPSLLSENIQPLQKETLKWVFFFGYAIGIIAFFIVLIKLKSASASIFYITCWLYLIGVVDAYSGIIPNRLLYVGLLGWGILLVLGEQEIQSAIPSTIIAVLLIIIRLVGEKIWKKPGFGWGDIKLIFVLGLLSGWGIFLICYISILSAGFFSIVSLILKKYNKYSFLPFAPHIVMGFFLVEIYAIFDIILSLTN